MSGVNGLCDLILYGGKEEDIISHLFCFKTAASKKNENGIFPLHYAAGVTFNPEVVKLILDAHPEAAAEKDNYDSLPLHHAAECNKNLEVVKIILDAYPQAAAEKNIHGFLPKRYGDIYQTNTEVKQLLLTATVREYRKNSAAKIIQRAWRECRYNPDYKMSERVFEKNIEDTVINYLPSNNYNF